MTVVRDAVGPRRLWSRASVDRSSCGPEQQRSWVAAVGEGRWSARSRKVRDGELAAQTVLR